MKINYRGVDAPETMRPLTSTMNLADIQIAGKSLKEIILDRYSFFSCQCKPTPVTHILSVRGDLWPSIGLARSISESKDQDFIIEHEGEAVIWNSKDGTLPENAMRLPLDPGTVIIKFPWQLIDINSQVVGILGKDIIKGEKKDGVYIDGHVILGEGSVLLPGVYIEGNVFIGKNCKIGPNCYIRGNTYIGDNCHVGNAVEIKNSLLMNKVSVGHLSYVGDSVIGPRTNFGAGTTTANLRHDGSNMSSFVNGEKVDTGRRKLGVICGENVHTGINTSIYPGRKIGASACTLPGSVVDKDID